MNQLKIMELMPVMELRSIGDELSDGDVSDYIDRVENDGGTIDPEAIKELIIYVLWLKYMGLWSDIYNYLPAAGYKAGKLYALVPNDGSGDYDVTRNSERTRVNPDGLIETLGLNVPAIDYATGEAVILMEEERTNLFLNSDTGATQTITVVNGSVYTFYFKSGAGAIKLSDAATQVINVSDA